MSRITDQTPYWKRPLYAAGTRRLGRRAFVTGAGVTAASLVLGSCGDDDDGTSTLDAATATPAQPVPTTKTEPKKGGKLMSVASATGLHYDHHQLPGIAGDGNVYNQLLKLGRGQEVMADLAEKWETPEPNVYIFHVRPGVKFQNVAPVNGRAMTAEDVVYTIDRARTDTPAFSNRWMWTSLTSIETPDANTVKATFAQPFAPALYHFAAGSMGVIAREVVEQFGDLKDWKSRIGTGPFILEELRKDEVFRYKRNPDYFNPQLPYLDAIESPVVPDRLSRIVALRTGQIDMIGWQNGVTDLEEAKRGMTDVTVETRPSDAVTVIAFNHTVEPLRDERVRKAISLAVDRQALIRAAGGEQAGVVVGMVHPNGAPFALPEAELADLTKPDIVEAKRLLSEAGLAGGFGVSLSITSTDVIGIDVASVLQDQLQQIGVKLTLDPQESASYIRKLTTKAFELIWIGSWTPALDPSQQYHGSLRSDAAQNWWGVNVPEVNVLDDKQQAELDNSKRAKIIQDLERLNFEKAIAVPLYALNGWTAWKNFVKDYDHLRAFNALGWQTSEVWLDK
ncbi:MAG: ABC transporter substrate-binding protein [Verrucomicrobiales bacterium]|nr:ABC transporter substrate-binding protein [Verrucomicrobiales bacterium]